MWGRLADQFRAASPSDPATIRVGVASVRMICFRICWIGCILLENVNNGLEAGPVIWCDQLASTPTAGFGVTWHFASGATLLESFAPILNRLVEDEKPTFSIDRLDNFATAFSTDEGFQYSAEPSKVVVAFVHKLRIQPVSGGLPESQLLSDTRPYSQLLPDVCRRLADVTRHVLSRSQSRHITRVGIVSTTMVGDEDLPPGIERLISYMKRPWNGRVDTFSLQIVSELDENDDWSDRCVHNIVRPEDKSQLMTVSLDWQRIFKTPRSNAQTSLVTLLADAQKCSSAYFESLAEGSRLDDLLDSAAISA